MTLLAEPLPRTTSLQGEADLQVERTDIQFWNVTPDRVAVEITIRNEGDTRSEETVALLSAAPLGAFVPWRPLDVLTVPALDPGETYILRTDAQRPETKPLGPPDRVPPAQLLTALGAEDDQPADTLFRAGLDQLLGRRKRRSSKRAIRVLPTGLFDLLGERGCHWAGNLNIFVGGKAVERHLAQALRVYPGVANRAMFVVGSGRDSYRFELRGTGVDWDAQLLNLDVCSEAGKDLGSARVLLGEWVKLRFQALMILGLCPPEGCGEGSVEVHVTQRSTGQIAVVEFSLDPKAAGAGCYVVG